MLVYTHEPHYNIVCKIHNKKNVKFSGKSREIKEVSIKVQFWTEAKWVLLTRGERWHRVHKKRVTKSRNGYSLFKE